jgi:hypothetical protein
MPERSHENKDKEAEFTSNSGSLKNLWSKIITGFFLSRAGNHASAEGKGSNRGRVCISVEHKYAGRKLLPSATVEMGRKLKLVSVNGGHESGSRNAWS